MSRAAATAFRGSDRRRLVGRAQISARSSVEVRPSEITPAGDRLERIARRARACRSDQPFPPGEALDGVVQGAEDVSEKAGHERLIHYGRPTFFHIDLNVAWRRT